MFLIEGSIHINSKELHGVVSEIKTYSMTQESSRVILKDIKRFLISCNKIWKGNISVSCNYIETPVQDVTETESERKLVIPTAHPSF